MPIIDLSHRITNGMVTYPGLPAPEIDVHLGRVESRSRYAPGVEFHIGCLWMVGNTGTYLDTPFHRFPDGWDLSELDLALVTAVPGLLVEGAATGPTGVDAIAGLDVSGKAVLVRTGWDRHFGTEDYGGPDHPHLAEELGDALVAGGATLVGIDAVNVDGTATGERPIHTALLQAGIPIVEHLRGLDALDPSVPFTFTAVPAPVEGLGTFPVRAFATTG